MHEIEPYFRWRDQYIASEDNRSPFFGRKYSEFYFSNKLYNFFLHPQWDEFGSATLYAKILFADYDQGFALIEMIGEWNDTLHNDIMFLKREVVDPLYREGISKFVFFCENVLNFHGGEDDYYAEWAEEVREESGWIALINTRLHVEEELADARLSLYMNFGAAYNDILWQTQKPQVVFRLIEGMVNGQVRRLVG
ncbi:MAG: hypothetical protein EP344_07050 [Bacteroidetes bacterium]|nr:MAG: hypothetical protein EP344_07050 [Bacteroidota bacterium]